MAIARWKPVGATYRWTKYRGYKRKIDAQRKANQFRQSGKYLTRLTKVNKQWVIYLRKK